MNSTASTSWIRSWVQNGFPHWFSWVVPLAFAAALLAVGRKHPPVQKTPTELMRDARALIEKNDHAGALRETEELLTLFPSNHIYLHQAADLATKLEQHNATAAYLERFVLSSPDPGEACPAITRAYRSAGNFEKMLDSAKRCAMLEPGNSDFKFELALANERAEKPGVALEQYQSGIDSFPGYGDFIIGHARVLLRLDRADEAWREISVYLEKEPGVADAELVAGLAADRTNQKDLARGIFERALQRHPENIEIKSAYERLRERDGVE